MHDEPRDSMAAMGRRSGRLAAAPPALARPLSARSDPAWPVAARQRRIAPAAAVLAAALAGCTQAPSPDAPRRAGPAPVAPAAAPAPGRGAAVSAPADAATRLTVYSGDYDQVAQWRGDAGDVPGYALVDSHLEVALDAGGNTVSRDRLPRTIDVAAVSLRPDAAGVRVVGQRFVSPPADPGALLSAALGQRVAVEHTSGGAKQNDSGILVAAGDGLVLALPDGRTKAIREYDTLSLLDGARQPVPAPALRWSIAADKAGTAGFDLSYPTSGLAWRAEYRAVLAKGGDCRLSLEGAALVANRSGVDFDGVGLTLVAGDPKRVSDNAQRPVVFDEPAPTAYAAAAPAPPPMPEPRRAGDYYAYPIPSKATLADGAIERVPLFAPLPGVACTRSYETAPAQSTWSPPRPLVAEGQFDATGAQPVKATVSFDNTRKAGLGRPLPAGRVRVFDGADFLGESRLGHTPAGATLHLETGTAFDLTAERSRKSFDLDRTGRTLRESFAVVLRNAGKQDATVVVVEPLPRWTDWEVLESSVPATRRDAQHAAFSVQVPAGGDATLAYVVRYRWAEGVKP